MTTPKKEADMPTAWHDRQAPQVHFRSLAATETAEQRFERATMNAAALIHDSLRHLKPGGVIAIVRGDDDEIRCTGGGPLLQGALRVIANNHNPEGA